MKLSKVLLLHKASQAGKVPIKLNVTRKGKTFMQTFWIKKNVAGVLNTLAGFFGTSKSKAKDVPKDEFNKHKSDVGVDYSTWESHFTEYFKNKSKWDSKFAGKQVVTDKKTGKKYEVKKPREKVDKPVKSTFDTNLMKMLSSFYGGGVKGGKDKPITIGDLIIQTYTDKSILITGDTVGNIELLRELKAQLGTGAWLKKQGGWVFPSKHKDAITEFLSQDTPETTTKPTTETSTEPALAVEQESDFSRFKDAESTPTPHESSKTKPVEAMEVDYSDVGAKIGLSRKDTARKWAEWSTDKTKIISVADLEMAEADNPEAIQDLLDRNRNFEGGGLDFLNSLRLQGKSAGTAYVISRLVANISKKPQDSALGRKQYLMGLRRFQEMIGSWKTMEDTTSGFGQIRDEMKGFMYTSDELEQLDKISKYEKAHYDQIKAERTKIWRDAVTEISNSGKKLNQQSVYKLAEQHGYDEVGKGTNAPIIENNKLRMSIKEAAANRDSDDPYSPSSLWRGLGEPFIKYMHGYSDAERNNIKNFYKLGKNADTRLNGLLRKADTLEKNEDWTWATTKTGEQIQKHPAKPIKVKIPNWDRNIPEELIREGVGKSKTYNTSKELMDTYGLRAVEYGNWMDKASSQHHTQKCGDALQDMAHVLGLDDVKKVSLNGRLAMAFGARGQGARGKVVAAAHYEPARKVINMTKHAGGGSLAHEWGHALDNLLPLVDQKGGGGHLSMASESYDFQSVGVSKEVADAMQGVMSEIHKGDLRMKHLHTVYPSKSSFHVSKQIDEKLGLGDSPEQTLSHTDISKIMQKYSDDLYSQSSSYTSASGGDVSSRYYKSVQKIAKYIAFRTDKYVTYYRPKKGEATQSNYTATAIAMGSYESEKAELFARAWESFVSDKMDTAKMKNSYLVYGVSEASAEAVAKMYQGFTGGDGILEHMGGVTSVVPRGEERQRINGAMETLLEAIKTDKVLEKASYILDDHLLKSLQLTIVETFEDIHHG